MTAGSSSFDTTAFPLRILPVRAGTLLFELKDLDQTLALFDNLEATPVDGITEIVPAARTLLVSFDASRLDEKPLIAAVRGRLGFGRRVGISTLVEIPVRYDGADLAEVATLTGLSVDEVIACHTGSDYTVAFTGFAPGFAYLTGGDPRLVVPRRTSPRTLTPAGAVGLAGEFSGIYPKASPGGWQLIGTTPLVMFDLNRQPAALLQPGCRVRFRDMAEATVHPVASIPAPADNATADPEETESSMTIVESPLPALLQDLGRPGLAAQGISRSGATDRASFILANRLAGNTPGAAALEIAPTIFRFHMTGAGVMALSGAIRPITIQPRDATAFTAGMDRPVALEDGDCITLGAPSAGLRSYLALRGGLAVAPVLGSAATDTLAGIGPAVPAPGERIGIRSAPAGAIVETGLGPAFAMPRAGETVILDVVMGPRTDWFTPASVESFLSQSWAVTPQSSRVGIRLSGAPLVRANPAELPSEATLRGSVQVPASGQPVLFLADHPLTGGYPVIATVASHHLDLAGQIPPGASVRFHAIAEFTDYPPLSDSRS